MHVGYGGLPRLAQPAQPVLLASTVKDSPHAGKAWGTQGSLTPRIKRMRHVAGRLLPMIKDHPLTMQAHAYGGSPHTHVPAWHPRVLLTRRITFRFREGSPGPADLSADSPIRRAAHTHAHTYMRTYNMQAFRRIRTYADMPLPDIECSTCAICMCIDMA